MHKREGIVVNVKAVTISKIALGGGCHWCAEAVFQSLKGVEKVEQGFVASSGDHNSFSEAVIVHFDSAVISLRDLIEIHLHTHRSTSDHSMRNKYRSAVYSFTAGQSSEAKLILEALQPDFQNGLITKVYPFASFKPSEEQFRDYYLKNPKKPFCERYILPKLETLAEKFPDRL